MISISIPINRKNLEPLKNRVADMYDPYLLYISGTEDCGDNVHVLINVFYRDPYQLFLLGQDLAFVDLLGQKGIKNKDLL